MLIKKSTVLNRRLAMWKLFEQSSNPMTPNNHVTFPVFLTVSYMNKIQGDMKIGII